MEHSYALSNPLSVLLKKDKSEFNKEDLIKVIEEKQIERITFQYTALDGQLKELKIPVVNRKQADVILSGGERVDGSSLFKGLVDASVSDLYVVPVYKTAFLNPFDSSSLNIICRYMDQHGNLAPFALDNILHKAAKMFKEKHGLELYALGELEFFLLGEQSSKLFPSKKQAHYHATAPFFKSGVILIEMVRYISQITNAVKYAHSEVGFIESTRSNIEEIRDKYGEQLEIEFLPTPIEEAADNLVLARWLIRNIAFKHGCVATFTPKIEEGIAGNGLHFHMELRKNGKNYMVDSKGKLNTEAKKLIGGLCSYADTLTAFGNTVSSAYLRLVPNQEAPTRICWSDLNRSTMIRVPLGWAGNDNLADQINPVNVQPEKEYESRQTVELRSPDGSAMIHLLLAGIAMAAEKGLSDKNSLELAEKLYVTGNIFKNPDLLKGLPSLPTSCVQSAKILLGKRELYEHENIFPASIIDYIAKMLNAENDEHMNDYLADLPSDDRLHETRKIMHRNLHKH
ncbi:MAG: glutamine synthetase [Calditrichia bacterium]|nr:glutamine synthetase [Calditrichia bacterium]